MRFLNFFLRKGDKVRSSSPGKDEEIKQSSETYTPKDSGELISPKVAARSEEQTSILVLDRRNPYDQISRLWTATLQGHRNLYPPAILYAYCIEAIRAMPELKFAFKRDEARVWGMLGSLLYKSLNPEWTGGFEGTVPCPEVRKCYEEALRCEPGDEWWEGWIERFS
jgi:hypothetical protein